VTPRAPNDPAAAVLSGSPESRVAGTTHPLDELLRPTWRTSVADGARWPMGLDAGILCRPGNRNSEWLRSGD